MESRILRKLLGCRREKVNRIQGAIYYLHDKIKQNEVGGACCLCGEKKNVYRVFMGKSEGKRLLGKHAHRWEDNIKMDLKEMEGGWFGFIWLKIVTSDGLL